MFCFARDYRYKWIKGITDTTRKQTQNAIADWISSGSPLSVLEAMLETVYGEARAKRIAVTEVTRVFSLANTEAWESTGVISQEVVHTAEDDLVCDICNPLDGTHIGIGDIDAKPPFHVNCRCFTTPVVDETLFERKLDNMLGYDNRDRSQRIERITSPHESVSKTDGRGRAGDDGSVTAHALGECTTLS